MTAIGYVSAPTASKVRTSNNYAYLAGAANLQGFDLQEPENPSLVGQVNRYLGADAIFITGDTAYIAAYENGVDVVDISNPQNPTLIATIDTPGKAMDVFADDTYIYVTDNEAGLVILQMNGEPVLSNRLFLPIIQH